MGPCGRQPLDDISGAVTVSHSACLGGRWGRAHGSTHGCRRKTVWPPSRRTAALALVCSPVLAGIIVAEPG